MHGELFDLERDWKIIDGIVTLTQRAQISQCPAALHRAYGVFSRLQKGASCSRALPRPVLLITSYFSLEHSLTLGHR